MFLLRRVRYHHPLVALYLLASRGSMGFNLHSGQRNVGTDNALSAPTSRRIVFSTIAVSSLVVSIPFPSANAFPFGDQKYRRQKELCIVNLLRLQYWAMTTASILEASTDIEQRKKVYLEARLGAKAMVAKKQGVGGGATPRVFGLLSLQIEACLDDLKYYGKNKKVDQLKDDLVEALASLVEFDGLETTQDPSPRSSLTLGQYNDQKAVYVQRMLAERITPLAEELVDYFGPETRQQCESYVQQYYSSELPPRPTSVEKTFSITEEFAGESN